MKKIRKKQMVFDIKKYWRVRFWHFLTAFLSPLGNLTTYITISYTQKSCDEIFFFLHLETCHLFFVQKNRKKEFRKYGKKVKFCLAKLVRNTSTVCLHCFQLSMPENKNFTYSNVALLRLIQKTSIKSGTDYGRPERK